MVTLFFFRRESSIAVGRLVILVGSERIELAHFLALNRWERVEETKWLAALGWWVEEAGQSFCP